MCLIYGANASGKSNVLQASHSIWLLFYPQEKEHTKVDIYAPFELSKGESTRYEITFWANKRCFSYILENNSNSIIYEKMTYTSDKGVMSELYERKRGEPITFGSTINIKSKQRNELNKETLKNHTVLSTLNKKNIDAPLIMKELYEWIKKNVHVLGVHNNGKEIAEEAQNNIKLKKMMLELLNKADFNISDFRLIDFTVPDEIAEQIKDDDDLTDSAKEKFLRPTKKLLLTHKTTIGDFQIEFGLESAGTKAYFRLARMLFNIKDCECVLIEDELEDSLHYELLIHYLQTFLQIQSHSQLIFTTHNQQLLDEDWMIRRDMVWLTEKNRETASTILSRASDLGIHKNVSLKNAYRIGKLGAKPILGSTLLINDL
ncbi:MAG: ATP-binding protein [Bacteroidales bacterium]|nr:ATP-binding protein [Bacteroidales bacterium]